MFDWGMYKGLQRSFDNSQDNTGSPTLSYQESANRVLSQYFKTENGFTKRFDVRLSILAPVKTNPIPKSKVSIFKNVKSLGVLRPTLAQFKGPMALDIETNGTQAADPNVKIYGIGLSTLHKTIYIDLSTCSQDLINGLYQWLIDYQDGIVGHNVMFDGTFLLRETGIWLDWRYDTYALYRQLANEGYTGFSYGLKNAQIQMLGWEDKGDVELDQWLIDNGYIADIKKEHKEGYHPGPLFKGEPRFYKAKKSEMFRAPAEILGYYCGLDAYSTILLHEKVFEPAIRGTAWEPVFREYHKDFLTNVKLLGAQQLTGITIDRDKLLLYKTNLEQQIKDNYYEFIQHPDVRKFADKLNEEAWQEYLDKEPEKFKKRKKLSSEPLRFKKDGSESVVWQRWNQRRIDLETSEPEVSQVWKNWEERGAKLKAAEQFNTGSAAQLARLFYQELGLPVRVYTDKGEPSVGAAVLPTLGELGQMLDKCREKEKELGYVTACLDHLIQDDNGDWRLHPQFKAPGTLTCRLAGSGGVNLQQIPKTRGYLECWRPKPGKAWIDFDFTALEPVVTTELSKDPNMFKIYGPGAKPNDIYLFNAMGMPGVGDKIRAVGYDPDSPTKEAIDRAKKECKTERQIAKQVSLASVYGAGAEKIRTSLSLQGVKISQEEAEAILKGYWNLYSKVKKYGYYLTDILKRNDNWVFNGIGRPVCCADEFSKDIMNRVVQSTGHDILIKWISIYSEMLDNAGIAWDGIVIDFHDQTIVECNEEDADKVIQILSVDSIKKLNEWLGGEIPLKVAGGRVQNLADAKCSD